MAPESGNTWLFEELTALRRELQEQHQRLRSDATSNAERIREDVKQLTLSVEAIRRDVLELQVQRDMEDRQAMKRSTLVSLGVSGLMSVVIAGVLKAIGWK